MINKINTHGYSGRLKPNIVEDSEQSCRRDRGAPARRPHHVRSFRRGQLAARHGGHQRPHLADRAEPGQSIGQLAEENPRRGADDLAEFFTWT